MPPASKARPISKKTTPSNLGSKREGCEARVVLIGEISVYMGLNR